MWWYLDGISDDGRYGLTSIIFIGSVFSPYYAWARARNKETGADPFQHCAVNFVLYGGGKSRWAMTERSSKHLTRDASHYQLKNSGLHWDGTKLTLTVDEWGTPIPHHIKGEVRIYPSALTNHPVTIGQGGKHYWWPLAPVSRIEVELTNPALSWSGHGYLDTNWGDEPLEDGFQRWDWSRAEFPDEGAAILYDCVYRDKSEQSFAFRFDTKGNVESFDSPPRQDLPSGFIWRAGRKVQADAGTKTKIVRTLEDTPFYTRSELSTTLLGQQVTAMHESLDCDRFASTWVQCLLPFRMPRFP